MRSRVGSLALATVLVAACWPFGGRSQPATSPLLANSPRVIDSLWQEGQAAYNRGAWGDATKIFTRLGGSMPVSDPRFSRLRFFQGEIELVSGSELEAVRLFRRVSDETPDDSLAPDALLRAGDAYAMLWRKPELDPTYGQTALGVYLEVQARYPGTSAAQRAAVKIADLNERFAYKEYRNALFYFQYKAYESAILSLRQLIAEYPRAVVVPEALERLVLAYKALGYEEDIRDTCQYIAQFHPGPDGPYRLCPVASDTTGAR